MVGLVDISVQPELVKELEFKEQTGTNIYYFNPRARMVENKYVTAYLIMLHKGPKVRAMSNHLTKTGQFPAA